MARKCKHLGKTYGRPYCKSTSVILIQEELKECTPELCPKFEYREQKFNTERCWSELCHRIFATKLERERGEQLHLMEKAGEIRKLLYQPVFILSKKPKITYTADFFYIIDAKEVYEDAKGVLTRDTRTKIAWVKDKFGIEVKLWPEKR